MISSFFFHHFKDSFFSEEAQEEFFSSSENQDSITCCSSGAESLQQSPSSCSQKKSCSSQKPQEPSSQHSCGGQKSQHSCGGQKSQHSCGDQKSEHSCGDQKSQHSCGGQKSQHSCCSTSSQPLFSFPETQEGSSSFGNQEESPSRNQEESSSRNQEESSSRNHEASSSPLVSSQGGDVQTVTFGCRLNFAESHVMESLAKEQQLKNTIIVNTCAVTKEAERQGKQHIRKLRKNNPEAFIIATGCAVQLNPHSFTAMKEVDRVVGNAMKNHKDSFAPKEEGPSLVMESLRPENLERPMPVLKKEGQTKAFVQIQNGCNHACAFCTIPRARGRSRSVPPAIIVQHIQELLDQGIQEIVLTGVDLTSYAYPHNGDFTLGYLLEHLLEKIPSMKRLRLSSLDSMEVDSQLFDLIVGESRILPHIHLSLQSGSDPILQAMRRRHSRQQALDLCQDLKKKRPEIALGADFIAGFPRETDDMFQETLDFVHEGSLNHLHVFPFSPRPKTEAFSMEPKVPGDIIKHRAQLLREKGQEALKTWLSSKIGHSITVLAEQPTKGHSCDFSQVHFTTAVTPGSLVEGKVLSLVDNKALLVEPII